MPRSPSPPVTTAAVYRYGKTVEKVLRSGFVLAGIAFAPMEIAHRGVLHNGHTHNANCEDPA